MGNQSQAEAKGRDSRQPMAETDLMHGQWPRLQPPTFRGWTSRSVGIGWALRNPESVGTLGDGGSNDLRCDYLPFETDYGSSLTSADSLPLLLKGKIFTHTHTDTIIYCYLQVPCFGVLIYPVRNDPECA